MKIVAIIYLSFAIMNTLAGVFLFGTERKPYSPGMWLANLIINLPLYWILIEYILNS